MRRTPGQIDELFLDAGQTGLTVGVRVLDNDGGTTIARTTGFTEFPAGTGLYYLDDFEFPDVRGYYTLLFDWDAGTAAPGFTATEELEITSSLGEPFVGDTYADTTELFRILKIRSPTAEQITSAERVLTAATYEIDQTCDREDDDPLSGAEVAIAQNVCLERARELWRLQEIDLGFIVDEATGVSNRVARDTWKKHEITLWPLKRGFGFA